MAEVAAAFSASSFRGYLDVNLNAHRTGMAVVATLPKDYRNGLVRIAICGAGRTVIKTISKVVAMSVTSITTINYRRGICMQNLYSSLTELLGRPEADPAFVQGLAQLDDPPKLLRDREHHREHCFSNSGFSLSADQNGIKSAFLHIATVATESGSMKPFIGELPFGICTSDTREDVERKIGKKTDHSQLVPCQNTDVPMDYWDDYECDSLILRFMFCSDHPGISALSISLRKDAACLQQSSTV